MRNSVHILNYFREKVFHTGERQPKDLVFFGGVSPHWAPWLDKPFFPAAGSLGVCNALGSRAAVCAQGVFCRGKWRHWYSHSSICRVFWKMDFHFRMVTEKGPYSQPWCAQGCPVHGAVRQLCLPPAAARVSQLLWAAATACRDACSGLTARDNLQLTWSHQEVVVLMGKGLLFNCHHPRQGEAALHLCAFPDRHHLPLHCW